MKPAMGVYQGSLIVETAPLLVADRLQFLMSERGISLVVRGQIRTPDHS
jgi:hypothetical protein